MAAKRFHCEACGPIDSALLDGYSVGDTLLEQVYFVCTIGRDGRISVAVTSECADYFKTLNQKKRLKEMFRFANKPGQDSFICPKCEQDGGMVAVVEDGTDAAQPTPRPAPKRVSSHKRK